MRRLVVASMLLLFSSTALALEPIPGEERFEELQSRHAQEETSISASAEFGQIGEDFFISFNPRFDLNLGLFGLGLQIPINLRVIDLNPKTDDNLDPLRKEDWDEPAEFLKFIRYVRFGNKRDFVYVRVGELIATIGHGTIMHRYVNNTDVDTFRTGLQVDLNTNYGGIETMISDIGFFDPNYADSRLFGVRGYVKPVGFIDPESVLNIFQIGATVVVDENAPYELETETVTLLTHPMFPDGITQQRAVLDDTGNFIISDKRPAVVFGFDVEAEVLNNWMFELIPYMDINFMPEGGDAGFHLGFNAALKLPLGLDFTIPLRVEYRHFGARYSPTYFGSLYEQERLVYGDGQSGVEAQPKLRAINDTTLTGGLNGWYGELAFDVGGYVQVGAIYEDFENSTGGILAMFVSVPALDFLQAKAYYARWDITDVVDIFNLDERSLMVAQLRMQIPYVPILYFIARYTRQWEINPITANVEASEDWAFGLDFTYDF